MIAIASASILPTIAVGDEAPRIHLTGHLAEKSELQIPGVASHELVEIDCPKELAARTTVVVPIDGIDRTLDLYRYSLRAADFELLVHDGVQLNLVEAPPHRTYRGTVRDMPGSSVRATILENGLGARITLGQGLGDRWVQPISTLESDGIMPPEGSTEETHVVMTGVKSAFIDGHRCGNDLYDLGTPDQPTDGGLAGDVSGNRLNSIAACADYEFFQKNGSNVDNTLSDIETMINFYESIYEDDTSDGGVNLNFEFSAAIIHASSNDPYSSSSADGILCEFRNEWNSGEETSIRRDVAQIYTGKNVTGSVIGLAWLGVVCNLLGNDCGSYGNLAYNMIESRYVNNYGLRTSLGAHELGHNYNAPHCDSYSDCEIMCSGNGACGSGTPNDFNPQSRASILSHINSQSCDIGVGDPIELPFLDEFDSISTNTWVFNKGGLASTSAVGEPSPSRSLQLDATGSGTYDADEIRTRSIQAAGYDPLFVSFHTQFRGVEAGEGVRVEYTTGSSGGWQVLDEILSTSGGTESSFTFHEYEMPASAQTNRLRLRFVSMVNSSGDDIYIDDLSIGDSSEPPVDPPSNDECGSATILTSTGTIPINLNGATNSAVPGCTSLQKDVWYYFVTGTQGTATVTLCGSAALDSSIALYTGLAGCPYQDSQLLECQDDSPECGDDPYIQYQTTDYAAVYIRIGSFTGETTDQDLLLTISIEEDETPCPGDFDLNGLVDGADLAFVLGAWNTADGDVNDDGNTDGADLSIVLGNWGGCP